MVIPTKLGSGGPDASRIVTVLVCGQVVPAGGLVPITVPTGAFAPTFWTVETRCMRCSAACAACSVSFCTLGTTEVKGPFETRRVIVAPFDTRPAGLVPTTMPLATALLCTRPPRLTVKPSAVRTAVAVPTLSPDTEGTCVNRPEVSHQPPSPSPTPSAMISTTMSSRGLNSQRPRNGSRPPWWRLPWYRSPSSRFTTRVWESSTRDGPVSEGPVFDGAVFDGAVPGPLAGGSVAFRAHHPLVAAGVSRASHGASASPWTPAPITPVSPLDSVLARGDTPPPGDTPDPDGPRPPRSGRPSLTWRTARRNSPAAAGRRAGSRLVASSTSWSTAAGMPGTSADGAGTVELTC